MNLDLHLHSKYSRCALTKPETAVKTAKKLGLEIAITDHRTTKAWKEFAELGKIHGVQIVLGEELLLKDENKKNCGELLGIYLNEEIKSRNYLEAIDEIRSQGGIIVAVHPFDIFRDGFTKIKTEFRKIDLIEGFNARCRLNSSNEKAKKFAKEKNMPMIASSDSHTPEEIGNGFTKVNASTLEEARKELLKGCGELVEKRKASTWEHLESQLIMRNLIKER